VDPSDAGVVSALACALVALNANSGSTQLLVSETVIQSTKQVVAGIKYHILFQGGLTSCHNGPLVANQQCPVVGFMSYFAVDVVVQPWVSGCGVVSVDGTVISPQVSSTTATTPTATTSTSTTIEVVSTGSGSSAGSTSAAPTTTTTSESLAVITSSINFAGALVSDFDSNAFLVMIAQYLNIDATSVRILSVSNIGSRRQVSLVVVVLITVPQSEVSAILAILDNLYLDTNFLDMFLASQPNIPTVTSTAADTSVSNGNNSASSSSSSTGIIVGVVVGCIGAVMIILLVALIATRRRSVAAAPLGGIAVSFENPHTFQNTHDMVSNPAYVAPAELETPYNNNYEYLQRQMDA